MYMKQKQVMDSYIRVRSFLEAYPATGSLTYASATGCCNKVDGR